MRMRPTLRILPMNAAVRERNTLDSVPLPGRRRSENPLVTQALLLLCTLGVATSSEVALGQGEAAVPIFKATVLDVSGDVEQISVPLNGSVTVEATIEVTRADVIANAIADAVGARIRDLPITAEKVYAALNLAL